MRKMSGKGTNPLPHRIRTQTRTFPLTKADLERGKTIGAKVDSETNPKMLVYYRRDSQ